MPSAEFIERCYRSLLRIRRVEEEIARVYPMDKIQSPVHLSIGQEAISVGACEALEPNDIVFGSYRSHALFLAKGGDLRGMISELYGKADGVAKGKAGSMHLIDPDAGVMGASAVVATTIPQAIGYAFAMRMRKENRVVVSFFGDGAAEEGVFHESLNFAQIKRLPILFLCENNDLAIHSRQQVRQATADICALARAHGLPAERLEKMDVFQIHDRVAALTAEARSGGGPRFLECICSRWKEHVGPADDFGAGYRTKDEVQQWIDRDEVKRVAGLLSDEVRRRVETAVEKEIADAFAHAERSPFPLPQELYTDLFEDAET